MHHGYLRIAVLAVMLATAGSANATQLRSSAYYSSSSTTEPSGFRCGSFVNGAGSMAECTDTAFYMDSGSGDFFQVDYSSQGSTDYGTLKTRSSLTFTPGVPDPSLPVGPTATIVAPVDVRELPSSAQADGGASLRDGSIAAVP